ncbi:hypothetical protein DMH04_22590 [Kibdelosporangium aridum]|uniref:ATPase AAA-type core domain-containing protein n=1 Tax=Kibdelosporangium aridum TaxID=2030 RepID=A0A428Z858_KIBAR|nr:hypothetical protein DMH04_22590 [Kibdelosporangium aridum]
MPSYDKEQQVVPVAAVYGANASGKSNLIDGLRFMASAVRDSFARWDADGGVPRKPFRLDPSARNEPSTFVVELVVEDVRYTYGFIVDDTRVLEEWLYSYPEKRRRILFERERDDMKFGTTVHGVQARLEALSSLLRPNALFLSLAGQSKLELLLPVYRWFGRHVSFLGQDAGSEPERVASFLRSGKGRAGRMVELLRVADLGISGVEFSDDSPEVLETSVRESVARLAVADANVKRLESLDGLAGSPDQREVEGALVDALQVRNSAFERYVEARSRAEALVRKGDPVKLLHGAANEPFALEDESAGTRSWLGMLPVVLTALDSGATLVVDEIDTSLHPVLVLRLVKLFHDKQTNPAGAQLVFTTHDATLLHPPLAEDPLARDEIWFVEKDRSGSSTLYPLTDFKPRAEDNLERRYLSGKYGAVPNVLEEDFIAAMRSGTDGEA